MSSTISGATPLKKPLPETLLVAYTTNSCNDLDQMEKVTKAIKEGVNVLIWSFIKIQTVEDESTGKQQLNVVSSQNLDNYMEYKKSLVHQGLDVVHLVAFGGWNGPHFPSGFSGKDLYEVFSELNTNHDSTSLCPVSSSFSLWDGIDWDLEGHDNFNSPTNEFTKECLDQVGEFSALAKKDGLVVSMAPPESYLDTTTSKFSRFVNLQYPEPWHREFQYHGWNVYAYILAKWGENIDFIFLQFYESYSHASYQIQELGKKPSDFLVEYVQHLKSNDFGYRVDFEDDPNVELKNQFVKIPLSKLVFGFANGWALNDGSKAIYFSGDDIDVAYRTLDERGDSPRGMGYWVVEEEGKNHVNFTRDLHSILQRTYSIIAKKNEEKTSMN